MLTLITGVPGAGKTLYCVDKILRDILGTKVTRIKEDGTTEEIERTIYTNIKGLVLDHVLIDGSEDYGIKGWHKWCKPGDFIVYDEIQKEWPPRSNGSKVPDYIQHLETHRHMGVDFVLLTQHPGLIDGNVRALVGSHLHVRRIAGSFMTIIYEWDHCSRQLLYSNCITKKPYRYSKEVFKLYKSSELHTKQKHTTPFLLYVAVIAIIAALYFIPKSYFAIANKSEKKLEENNKDKKTNIENNQSQINGAISDHPQINDLVFVGHIVFGKKETLFFEWHQNGQYRAVLTASQLLNYGYTIQTVNDRHCVVNLTLNNITKTMGCLPPPLRYQKDQNQAMMQTQTTVEGHQDGHRRSGLVP